MTFYGYMKRNYYNKEGRKADLANDMAGDEAEFPTRVGASALRIVTDMARSETTWKAVRLVMLASMSLKSAGRNMNRARKAD